MAKSKPTKKKTATLTIRLTEGTEVSTLLELQKLLNEKTGSGALMKAAELLPKQIKANQQLTEEINKMKFRLSEITEIVEHWLDSQNKMMAIQKSIKQMHKLYPRQSE